MRRWTLHWMQMYNNFLNEWISALAAYITENNFTLVTRHRNHFMID